jgi:hypothetical protein
LQRIFVGTSHTSKMWNISHIRTEDRKMILSVVLYIYYTLVRLHVIMLLLNKCFLSEKRILTIFKVVNHYSKKPACSTCLDRR